MNELISSGGFSSSRKEKSSKRRIALSVGFSSSSQSFVKNTMGQITERQGESIMSQTGFSKASYFREMQHRIEEQEAMDNYLEKTGIKKNQQHINKRKSKQRGSRSSRVLQPSMLSGKNSMSSTQHVQSRAHFVPPLQENLIFKESNPELSGCQSYEPTEPMTRDV